MFHSFTILENVIPKSENAWIEMQKFINDCFEVK